MTIASKNLHGAPAQRTGSSYQLAVSSYDRVASLLISLLIFVGVTVFGLLVVYFTSKVFARQKPVPVTMIASRPENASLGLSRDLEPPGLEEVPELTEPQLQETLSAVSDVSSKVALLDDEVLEADLMPGKGSGAGDNRQAGVGSEGVDERVPRPERWEIRFEVETLEIYARQLDHFEIELATFSGDNQVHYAFNLTKPQPDRVARAPDKEKRMYMSWRDGRLIRADRKLLAKAGIRPRGGVVLQFYPAQVESKLATLEIEKLREEGRNNVNQVRKTIFGIQASGNGFAFHVIEQNYF